MDQNSGDPAGGGGGTGSPGASGAPGGQGTGAGGDPATPPAFSLPDAYKEKAYLKDAKSMDDVYKMLDGAQTLLGKRAVPDEKAPQEEWDKYYASVGRPEKAELYEFDDSVLGENNPRDAELSGKVKGIFHAAGLSTKQAKAVQVGYDKLMGEFAAAQDKAFQEQNAKFDTDAQALFGDRKDKALANARDLMAKHLPESMKGHLEKLGNQELLIMASVLDGVHTKFMTEDAPVTGGGAGAKSIGDLQAEAHALMAKDEYRNNTNPQHETVRGQVRALFEQIHKLKGAANQQ